VSPEAPVAHTSRSGSYREVGSVVLVGVIGAALVLLMAGRTWITLSAQRSAPFKTLVLEVTGRTLYPALTGLAVVGLLGILLLLVTAGWVRLLFATLLSAAGLGTLWFSIRGLSDPGPGRSRSLLGDRSLERFDALDSSLDRLWPILSILGAVLLSAAGVVAVLRCRGWQVGLSSRYASPAEAARIEDPWRRMDRGDDPTLTDR
jgi:hypothetical protein